MEKGRPSPGARHDNKVSQISLLKGYYSIEYIVANTVTVLCVIEVTFSNITRVIH